MKTQKQTPQPEAQNKKQPAAKALTLAVRTGVSAGGIFCNACMEGCMATGTSRNTCAATVCDWAC